MAEVATLGVRFELPFDDSRMVGQPEVMVRSGLQGLLPACPSSGHNPQKVPLLVCEEVLIMKSKLCLGADDALGV
jgi:hypothetical protein